MIVVIFEGLLKEGKLQDYLAMTTKYPAELNRISGFISNERYESTSNPGKILSVSFWNDEESIKQLKDLEMHQEDEKIGRDQLFDDYRICVTHVVKDYGLSSQGGSRSKSTS